jgi:hypothetical protein
MALSNHTIDSSKVTEEQVEVIVDGKVKYDPVNQSIVFLPDARDFSNDKKILLYLAALRGWSFLVSVNTPAEDASPLEITKATGIPGGSVRPLLRALEDRKIVSVKKGRYQVLPHNLAMIASILAGEIKTYTRANTPSAHSKAKGKGNTASSKKVKRSVHNNKPTLAEGFKILLDQKWFKEGKTIIQLKEKLDEMTIFPPMSQLPSYLLKACRTNQLSRSKDNRDGKNIWVYYQK